MRVYSSAKRKYRHQKRVPNPAVEEIAAQVGLSRGVSASDILDGRRTKAVALARAVAMMIARERYGYSYPELGRYFGKHEGSCRSAILSLPRGAM